MRTETDQIIYLKDYTPSPYLTDQVDMRVEFGPQTTRIVTQLTIVPAEETGPDTPLVLDGDDLTLVTLALDGAPVTEDLYEATPSQLTLFSPPARRFVLETEVQLTPEANTTLMGLYRSNGIWCTQCEPEGFRRITYFNDRPDILARYRVKMTADKTLAPVLLANGNPIESGDLGDGRHYAVWDDPFPKPSYLFAMVAGDLGVLGDSFTTVSGREVALAIYCEPGKESQCAYALDALKRSMAWDEQRFGREYDLDVFNIVAVSDFNFGAMENKGLNIFNDRYVLAKPETATDSDYAGVESVIAHEYFHNWTGNRITCRDWFQLCLKEGLTVFRDQEFTSDQRSRPVKRIEDVRGLRMAQFPEDSGPLAHPARPDQYREINNFYTATVYEKGAEIVRMLATMLGEKDFRRGTDLYFERHDGQATTIEAWLKVFEDATGRDLQQFGAWYTQAGTPHVAVSDSWDAASKVYELTLKQHTPPTPGQPEKKPMVIPIKFGLVGPNGHDMEWRSVEGATVTDDLIIFDKPEVTLRFEGLPSRPAPSLLRGFSAPVKLKSGSGEAEKLFLARHDSDPFNRWQAMQDVALNLMLEAVTNGGTFGDRAAVDALGAGLGDTLTDGELDDAFKAHALALPSEPNVAQALGTNVDPALIRSVRRSLLKHIGVQLADRLLDTYEQLGAKAAPYSTGLDSTRARALRNQCLALLAVTGMHDDLVSSHYRMADNMTDRFSALVAAATNELAGTESLLEDFHARFAAEPLVQDKWLSLTASRPDEQCLERVEELFEAPEFPRTNPNRLRALIGSFAMSNAVQFARPDGAGFRFVANACAEIDRTNPQVAARILTAFKSWRSYEPRRRQAAGDALEELAKTEGLSRNTADILARTLSA